MSDTAANAITRIKLLYNDDATATPWSDTRILDTLSREMLALASDLALPDVWNAALFATVAGTFDYNLPTGTYATLRVLKLATTGSEIVRYPMEVIEAMRYGPSGSVAVGPPSWYGVIEGSTQVTTLRLYPTPNSAENVSSLHSVVPARLTLTSDVIGLDAEAMGALENRVAAVIVDSLDDESLERFKIGPGLANVCRSNAERLLQASGLRMNQMRRMVRQA